MNKRISPLRVILRIILIILMILVLVVGGYVAYVLIDYHRLDDNLTITPEGTASQNVVNVATGGVSQMTPSSTDIIEIYDGNGNMPAGPTITPPPSFTITSWNIGFAAYTDQFSFFMDGGLYSRAFSEKDTIDNMEAIVDELLKQNSDFYLVQEVDFGSTRSYHVDEKAMIEEAFSDKFSTTFGVNYDSPYLFYPISCPIGASKSGILTMSYADITGSVRRSFPIQTGFAKLLDLDRCFTVNRIPCSNGKEFVLINLHASAYTTDDTIVTQQMQMLADTIAEEYSKGNYVIAGGDFNMDLLGDSGSIFGVSGEDYSWAQPFPTEIIPDGARLVAPNNPMKPVPSCRNADAPWDPELNFQITIDGFIVTDNIEVWSCEVTDQQFAYSDHQPVQLRFRFK